MERYNLKQELKNNGDYVLVDNHMMHIYRAGAAGRPTLVFMSGSGTVAPVYDFKVLYQKLVSEYRIIVIEKSGYGYSDIYDAPGDIDTVVAYQRQALQNLGENDPYILLPHSMSGLEAIRWKQKYSNEIRAIIGLDMALPVQYIEWGEEGLNQRIKQILRLQKLHKKGLLFWYPLSKRGLDREEVRQQRLLWKRNAFNNCIVSGARAVLENARTVDQAGEIKCPMLLFVSNGKQVSSDWIPHQCDFATQMHAEVIRLDCGHYIHYYESDRISEEIKAFCRLID